MTVGVKVPVELTVVVEGSWLRFGTSDDTVPSAELVSLLPPRL